MSEDEKSQDLTIKELSKMMAKQDIAMLITRHGDDSAVRPMSNNKDVEFDGDTFFFSSGDSTSISDIKSHSRVSVTYQDTEDDIFIALTGTAKLHTDKDILKKHWKEALSAWFEDGLDTDGLTLIEINADRVHYWLGRDEGELTP